MHASQNTTVVGASLGAATGGIAVYLIEILSRTDIPSPIEGMIIVVATALVALLYPANPPA